MLSQRKTRFRGVSLALVAGLLSACGAQNLTVTEAVIPPPLMDPQPYRIAVQYSEGMYDYTHKEEMLGNKQWTIKLGAANKRVYDQILVKLFDDVSFLGPSEPVPENQYDLVLRPSIQAFEFAIPQQSRTEAYTVWIRYQIEVFNRFGTRVGAWPINAYGKSGAERFEGEAAIQRAAVLAMRDAAALLTIRVAAQATRAANDKRGGPDDPALAEGAEPADLAIIDGDASVAETTDNGGEDPNPTIESAEKLRYE
ncbi:MAG: hypothetical protein AAGH76_14435 [Pseudomonadota bacterium]